MKRRRILVASLAAAAMLSAPAVLSADTNQSTREAAKVSHVAVHLSTFEQQAAKISRDAETLLSLTRNQQTGWESHTYYLSILRHGIDDMGRMLEELEEMKPQASDAQQMAIERARPHLVAVADATGEAISLLRPGRWNLRQPEYKETVADLSQHANGLYQTVDTIIDYHNANDRLQSLEPAHGSSQN
ncbi:MAG: hypothetical protein LAO09_08005 [Acidobacteriia bacterium]|nr:hypothetical protein [Terriglobia bacterium]